MRCLPILLSLCLAFPALAQEEDPLALGPRRDFPELGVSIPLPAALDPGAPQATDPFGSHSLGFYFSRPDHAPLQVLVESRHTLDHLVCFERESFARLKQEGWAPGDAGPFRADGFDAATRRSWHHDGKSLQLTQVIARSGRRAVQLRIWCAADDLQTYAPQVSGLLEGFTATPAPEAPFPVAPGWRFHDTENFQIATDADDAVASAVGELLEAGLAQLIAVFPDARRPTHPYLAMFFGNARAFADFREKNKIPTNQLAFLFEGARVLALGVLPVGKQSRRFARAEIDVLESVRCLTDLFFLHAAGKRPEPWFADGAALHFGIGLSAELEFEERDLQNELALALEEDISKRRAPALSDLFHATELDEDGKTHAAGWFTFFRSGPGMAKKGFLEAYLAAFAETRDGAAARQAAFGKQNMKNLARTHARWVLYLAMRAKRGR